MDNKIMCKIEPGEPFWAYAWRQFCEKPYAVTVCVSVAACCYLYLDLRGFFSDIVTEVQGMRSEIHGMKNELIEMNIRIQNIEKQNKP